MYIKTFFGRILPPGINVIAKGKLDTYDPPTWLAEWEAAGKICAGEDDHHGNLP